MHIDKIYEKNREFAEKAVNKMDGPAECGRKITFRMQDRGMKGKKVTIGQVWAWLNRDKRGIPLEYLVDVEEESGVAREKLRADVPWRK